MVKNPNWQEADQLAIYIRGRGVELGATEKQLQLAVRAGPPDYKSGGLTHSTCFLSPKGKLRQKQPFFYLFP